MLHRLFQKKTSPKSSVEHYVRRILYMYKTDMEDAFSTDRYSVEELRRSLETYGWKPTEYYLKIFSTSCAVFLYNKKKNRYERVQRRFLENDLVCALRPTASTTRDTDAFVEHGKYATKTPHRETIHDKEVIGDHWMPEYVYHYTVVSS